MAKNYPELKKVLRKLLFEKNMKAVDLAREVNLPQPTIHRLVTGKSSRPYKSSLEPIAKYFSISVDQLIGEVPLVIHEEKNGFLNNEQDVIPAQAIPVISWKNSSNNLVAKAQSKLHIPAIANISDAAFALLMNDYSMEPLFPKDCMLIFDPAIKPYDRSYVLVKLASAELPIVRQLLIDAEHQYLKPLNPDLNTYKMRLLGVNDRIIACLFESRTIHLPANSKELLED